MRVQVEVEARALDVPGHRRRRAGLPQRGGGEQQRVVGARRERREGKPRAGEAEQVERLGVPARRRVPLDGGAEGGQVGGVGPGPARGDGALAREARAGLEWLRGRGGAGGGGRGGGSGGGGGLGAVGEEAEVGEGRWRELQVHGEPKWWGVFLGFCGLGSAGEGGEDEQ